MNRIGFVLAVICIATVQSSYESAKDIHLQSVPDLSSYGKTMYPTLGLQELGEYYEEQHVPEVIKVIKKVAIKVPYPYPVKVFQKVPVPVAYKVPQIVKVPHIIKIAQPVPVEVVKKVPVPVPVHEGTGYASGQGGSLVSSFGGDASYQVQDHSQAQPSGDGGFQPSSGYGTPFAQYGLPQEQSGDAYQHYGNADYSTLAYSGASGQASGFGDHDIAAQASSAAVPQEQPAESSDAEDTQH